MNAWMNEWWMDEYIDTKDNKTVKNRKTRQGCLYLASPVLSRQRQEDVEFKASLEYSNRSLFQNPSNQPHIQTAKQTNKILLGERKKSYFQRESNCWHYLLIVFFSVTSIVESLECVGCILSIWQVLSQWGAWEKSWGLKSFILRARKIKGARDST